MTSGTRSNNEGKHIKTNTEIKTFKRKNKKKSIFLLSQRDENVDSMFYFVF
jgi:hypothetical protein